MELKYEEVKYSLETIKGIKHVHSLRLWALTIDIIAANAHLQIGKSSEILIFNYLFYLRIQFNCLGLVLCIGLLPQPR